MDAEGQDEPEAGVELLTFLSAYRTLQDRWERAFFDKECRQDAPWSALVDPSPAEDTPMTSGEQLMWHAEETAVVAALAVGHHLGLLARAYWLDPLDPDGPVSGRWLYSAPYASARAIAEGTAMVRWLLDPEPDREERVRRGAVGPCWRCGPTRTAGSRSCGRPGSMWAGKSALTEPRVLRSCGLTRRRGRYRSTG